MFIQLMIIINGADLDPDAVTASLGVTPSSTRKRGDSSGNPKKPPFRKGVWEWNVAEDEDDINDSDINRLVKAMAETFGDGLERLDKQDCEYAFLDIMIMAKYENLDRADRLYKLSPESTKIIAKTGLPVEFTVYRLEPEDDFSGTGIVNDTGN